MQDQVFGANSKRTFYFAAEGFHRFPEEEFVGRSQVHKIVGVNRQRLQIVLLAKLAQFVALGAAQVIGRPLSGTRRENLESAAAQTICPFGGVLYASGNRGVNADAPGGPAGRAFRRWSPEDVLFLGDGAGHRFEGTGSCDRV